MTKFYQFYKLYDNNSHCIIVILLITANANMKLIRSTTADFNDAITVKRCINLIIDRNYIKTLVK